MKPWPEPWLTAPHFVYELYAADGTCLYVGCTLNLVQRLRQHSVKDWWPEIARAEANRHPDQAAGRAAERERIQALNPTRNQQFTDHNPTAFGWAMRKARAEERHARGEMCQPGTQCKECNEVHRDQGVSA